MLLCILLFIVVECVVLLRQLLFVLCVMQLMWVVNCRVLADISMIVVTNVWRGCVL